MAHNHSTNNSYLTRNASLPSYTNTTVSMWVRPRGGAGTFRAIYQLANTGGGDVWLGIGTSNNFELWVSGGTGGRTIRAATIDTWHWLGLVMSSATNRTGYGSQELGTISSGTETVSFSGTPNIMYVGNSTFGEPCECEIAAIKIWDAALTLDELRSERAQIVPVRFANLHLWTPCFSASDTRDWGPSARNWTVNGTIVTAAGPPIPWTRAKRKYIFQPSAGNNIYTFTASGGYTLAGDATISRVNSFAPTGGLTLAGDAGISRVNSFAPSGGYTLAGDATIARINAFEANGGVTLAGDATVSKINSFAPSGGIILAGAADASYVGGPLIYDYTASGGYTLAGDALFDRVFMFTPSGGMTLSGDAITSLIRTYLPTGGIVLSGNAALQTIRNFLASSGITFNGEATASYINASAGTKFSLTHLFDLFIRLDVKEAIDSGEVQANAGDTNGTQVNFNKSFKDIRSITVSLKQAQFNYIVTYDFQDVPNPTGFKVYVWDAAGNRQSALVTWIARGVI